MKPDKIHIGNIIRQKVKQNSLSVTGFAKLINRSRSDVYDIFKRPNIDTDLLLCISKVLDYDFMEYLCTGVQKPQITAEYMLITMLNENEIPEEIPENSVLLKVSKQNKTVR
ncbi:MAG: transcriptional regulator [Prevotellaceae bacterium]|jgi:hypothetical protein|nr:transcriptional regulator [Prevotellaceae bacterium]